MLALRTVEAFGQRFLVFPSSVRAYVHISDHLLSRPEGFHWIAAIPELGNYLSGNRAFESAKSMWMNYPEETVEARKHYARYTDRIALALRAAELFGWHGDDVVRPGDMWAVGMNGEVVYLAPEARGKDGWVRTCFIPEMKADPEFFHNEEGKTDEQIATERKKSPLPRDNSALAGSESPPIVVLTLQNLSAAISFVRIREFWAYGDMSTKFANQPRDWDEWREMKKRVVTS